MKKVLMLIAVLLLGVVANTSAQVPPKPFNIYGAVGLSIASSPADFKDGWGNGFHGDAQLGFNTFPKGEILLNLGYHKFSPDTDFLEIEDGGDISAILVGGDFKFNLSLPAAPIKPYLFAGVGLAVLSTSEVTYLDGPLTMTEEIDSRNEMYFQFGGGIEFSRFFIRAKYVNIKNGAFDEDEEDPEIEAFTNASMIPISIGIKF